MAMLKLTPVQVEVVALFVIASDSLATARSKRRLTLSLHPHYRQGIRHELKHSTLANLYRNFLCHFTFDCERRRSRCHRLYTHARSVAENHSAPKRYS